MRQVKQQIENARPHWDLVESENDPLSTKEQLLAAAEPIVQSSFDWFRSVERLYLFGRFRCIWFWCRDLLSQVVIQSG
jgi:hypothetical protein